MEEKITLFPLRINGKDLNEDWIEEFMGNHIVISTGNFNRLIGCPFDDNNAIECSYWRNDNKIVLKCISPNDNIDVGILAKKIVYPFASSGAFVKVEENDVSPRSVTCSFYHD